MLFVMNEMNIFYIEFSKMNDKMIVLVINELCSFCNVYIFQLIFKSLGITNTLNTGNLGRFTIMFFHYDIKVNVIRICT